MSTVRYHLNPETGKPGRCDAAPGNCRFKTDEGESQHYESAEAARAGYELQNGSLEVPEVAKVDSNPKKARKPRMRKRISGVLGERTASLDIDEFRALPVVDQIKELAGAYGYTGELPDRLNYQKLVPGWRHQVGHFLTSGDLIHTASGKLAIYYSPSLGDYYTLFDPLTGRSIKDDSYALRKIKGVSFGKLGPYGHLRPSPVPFAIHKELEKNDPHRERHLREKEEEDNAERIRLEEYAAEEARRNSGLRGLLRNFFSRD